MGVYAKNASNIEGDVIPVHAMKALGGVEVNPTRF
jgi:hypothetical protein